MSCTFPKETLSAYMDNELSQTEVAQVKEHLRKCSECVRDVKDLQSLVKTVHGWPSMAAPVEVTRNIREEVNAGQRSHTLPFIRRRWVYPAVAVAAVTLVAVSVILFNPQTPSNAPRPAGKSGEVALSDSKKAADKDDHFGKVGNAPTDMRQARSEQRDRAESGAAKDKKLTDELAKRESKQEKLRESEPAPAGELARAKSEEAEEFRKAADKPENKPEANRQQARSAQPPAPADVPPLQSGAGGALAFASGVPVVFTVTSADFKQDTAKITQTLANLQVQHPNIWVNLASSEEDRKRKNAAPNLGRYILVECSSQQLAKLQVELNTVAAGQVRLNDASHPTVKEIVKAYGVPPTTAQTPDSKLAKVAPQKDAVTRDLDAKGGEYKEQMQTQKFAGDEVAKKPAETPMAKAGAKPEAVEKDNRESMDVEKRLEAEKAPEAKKAAEPAAKPAPGKDPSGYLKSGDVAKGLQGARSGEAQKEQAKAEAAKPRHDAAEPPTEESESKADAEGKAKMKMDGQAGRGRLEEERGKGSGQPQAQGKEAATVVTPRYQILIILIPKE